MLCLLMPVSALADHDIKFRVVLDAGHGGHDPGTVGRNVKEKDIALALALRVGDYISQNMPDVEVIYTRKTDEFIELHKRAQIANEKHADLFISIHCNGVRSNKPMGTETWVMGLHKSEANLEVAKAENAVILLEEDYPAQYDGFNPNTDEAYIIFSFFQSAFLNQSLEMARLIQDQFLDRARRVDRGVKQAGFLVLYRTTMPGVLVEAGFLSNAEEEAYLASEEGQAHIASSIYRALREYRTYLDQKGISSRPRQQTESQTEETSSAATDISTPGKPASTAGVSFAIQVRSSAVRLRTDDAAAFPGLRDVREYAHGGMYKYYTGELRQYDEAMEMLTQLRNRGFTDAFVIAFRNGERIPLKDAQRESNTLPGNQ